MPVTVRTYNLTVRNKLAIGLFLLLGLGVAGALLMVGLALAMTLVAGGAVIGAGTLLYRAITGRGQALPRPRDAERLDPALEVSPPRRTLSERTTSERDDR